MSGSPLQTDLSGRLMPREVAFELHDGPTQLVSAALMDLESALGCEGLSENVKTKIRAAQTKLRHALADLRRVIRQLENKPEPQDEGLPLTQGIALIAQNLRQSGVDVRVALSGPLDSLPGFLVGQVLRVFQEATSNAIRHGAAKTIWLSAVRIGQVLQISVRDFGVGFRTASVSSYGVGLRSIAERVTRVGGWVTLDSSPGRGTRLFVSFPINALIWEFPDKVFVEIWQAFGR